MASDGSIILSTQVDTSGLEKGLSSIKSGVAAFGKAFAVAGTAAAAGFAAMTTASVKAAATNEQLVGGVQTLFNETALSLEEYANSVSKTVEEVEKEWQTMTEGGRIVEENAANAYKNAGLSANAYMETVTSFSASLIQSLDGDTVEAAKVADMAIVDMADNANKMGTSIESIQFAYQGFAKQNYTIKFIYSPAA